MIEHLSLLRAICSLRAFHLADLPHGTRNRGSWPPEKQPTGREVEFSANLIRTTNVLLIFGHRCERLAAKSPLMINSSIHPQMIAARSMKSFKDLCKRRSTDHVQHRAIDGICGSATTAGPRLQIDARLRLDHWASSPCSGLAWPVSASSCRV